MDPILRLFPFMCAALIVHLVEEIHTGFRRKFPLGEMPRSVFVTVNIIVYSWALAAYLSYFFNHPWGPSLVFFFSLAVLGNGLFHLGYMVLRRRYFPGGITAGALVPLGGVTMLCAARHLL